MNWKDLATSVADAAPVLGGLLGGPAGAAVGSIIASTLGTENTPDAVDKAIKANPDAALKLAEIQENTKVQLQQLAVQAESNKMQAQFNLYQAEASDRDSARKLAAQQPKDWVRPAITMILLLGAIGITMYILSGVSENLLKDSNATLLIGTLVGYLFSELKQATAFWFGQTKDSATQAETITRLSISPNLFNKGKNDAKP